MEFHLDTFLKGQKDTTTEQKEASRKQILKQTYDSFYLLCEEVKEHIHKKQDEDTEEWLTRQKNAILGYPKEVQFYLNEINFYLHQEGKISVSFPNWYDQLDEAIFHENWGLAGIYEWVKEGKSSSCKVIQPRIYFLKNGRAELQPQKLTKERFNKLRDVLLMNDTSKRKNSAYQEIYMLDGTRIEIYNNTKESTIIFRRYIVDNYSFEHLASLGTIDEKCIPMLKAMVCCGFNVNMLGPVRSGKTTFLTTYQSYENPSLEGVLIETDPEIPLHQLMPTAPIIQMVADNEELEGLLKPLMRSDGDYLVMGEARDGRALRLMLMITKKGTRRVKGTYHTGNAEDFCYDVAQEIVNIYGGNVWAYMIQIAKSFHFLFEFTSLPENKGAKRLKGIYEIRLDPNTLEVTTHKICEYDFKLNTWRYSAQLGGEVERIGNLEDPEAFQVFKECLVDLAKNDPIQSETLVSSPFTKLLLSGRN